MLNIKLDPVPVVIVWTRENYTIATAVDGALHKIGLHAFITSGADHIHGAGSRHYINQALDFRIVWKKTQERGFLKDLSVNLPKGYRYLMESNHLHVERHS